MPEGFEEAKSMESVEGNDQEVSEGLGDESVDDTNTQEQTAEQTAEPEQTRDSVFDELEKLEEQRRYYQRSYDNQKHTNSELRKEMEEMKELVRSLKEERSRSHEAQEVSDPISDPVGWMQRQHEDIKNSVTTSVDGRLTEWQKQQQAMQEAMRKEQEAYRVSMQAESEYNEYKKRRAQRGDPVDQKVDQSALNYVVNYIPDPSARMVAYRAIVEANDARKPPDNLKARVAAERQQAESLSQAQVSGGDKPESAEDRKTRLNNLRKALNHNISTGDPL